MISEATSCFQNCSHLQGLQGYGSTMADEAAAFEPHHTDADIVEPSHSGALLYSLSVLKDKVQQVQTLATIVVASPNHQDQQDQSLAIAGMGTLIQGIIMTASSMMFTCQQLALGASSSSSATNNANNNNDPTNPFHEQHIIKVPSDHVNVVGEEGNIRGLFDGDQSSLHCFSSYKDNSNIGCTNIIDQSNSSRSKRNINTGDEDQVVEEMRDIEVPNAIGNDEELLGYSPWNNDNNCDIIELNANDLLAKYTHYCQVCGKGFKRDANLRMHMRAHGDEYKSKAALSNPMKKNNVNSMSTSNSELEDNHLKKLPMRKYSCPQEGCRWNRKHAKFQPLKSMICVKNHYKRSHCPKMYVCNRCNQKQFSVLSDLRTHEKHCGELKWQCSCGTTFSRKDKLMGHVALFFGHAPVGNFPMNNKQEHPRTLER